MPLFDLTGRDAANVLTSELVVVMPIYNEEANIANVVEEWKKALEALGIQFQFLLINDGSKDTTLKRLRLLEESDPERMVIIDKPNSGHGRSCRLGYDLVAASSVEWVLQIDSDGQCDPQYFREFWAARNDVDCVFGQRTKRDDGLARTLTSQICRWTSSLLCGVDLVDPNVPYRLLRTSTLRDALKYIPSGFNIHNVAMTFVLKKRPGVRFAHLPIHFRDRQGGNNSINLLNVAQWGGDMLVELWKLQHKLQGS